MRCLVRVNTGLDYLQWVSTASLPMNLFAARNPQNCGTFAFPARNFQHSFQPIRSLYGVYTIHTNDSIPCTEFPLFIPGNSFPARNFHDSYRRIRSLYGVHTIHTNESVRGREFPESPRYGRSWLSLDKNHSLHHLYQQISSRSRHSRLLRLRYRRVGGYRPISAR
jgi:hypothetical protein